MEQATQIAFFILMIFTAVYTMIVIVALILAALGFGKIRRTKFNLASLVIVILWMSGFFLWLNYFNII